MSESKTSPDRERQIWESLAKVMDPEIPDLSVVDLGLIAGVSAIDTGAVVKLTPSFAACPAINLLQDQIATTLKSIGFKEVRVDIVYDPPWNTDRITELGREKLKLFGLAPPPFMSGRVVTEEDLEIVTCPYCDKANTTMESTFGPTLCRSIHYCNDCQQSFEHFKPVT